MKKYRIGDTTKSLSGWAIDANVSRSCMSSRIKKLEEDPAATEADIQRELQRGPSQGRRTDLPENPSDELQ